MTLTVAAAVLSVGQIGLALAGLAGLVLVWALIEPYWLQVSRSRLGRAAPGPAPLNVLLVSDLHTEWLRISPARLAKALAACPADVLLFAGDIAGSGTALGRSKPWLDVLSRHAASQGIPLLAVPGNHDSLETLDELARLDFTVLRNETALVSIHPGVSWLFLGLDELKSGRSDLAGVLGRLSPAEQAVPASRRIVLAHNPDCLLDLTNSQTAAFFLAGHFHGGQIWMPFHLEFWLLRREKVGRLGFHRGRFSWHGIEGYITQGLGCVLFPLRLFSRPEVAVLELVASE